jgi:hypothetical protein
MQRFKKEMKKSLVEHEMGSMYGEKYQRCADHRNKFAYGARGALTEAACYRLAAIVNIPHYLVNNIASYRAHLIGVRHMMEQSRRLGCYLPK